VRETPDVKMRLEQSFHLFNLIDGYSQIQIQADQGLNISVDRLPSDDAVLNLVFTQQSSQFLDHICPIQGNRFPKGECLHGDANWCAKRLIS
jgi:hypothetical protein